MPDDQEIQRAAAQGRLAQRARALSIDGALQALSFEADWLARHLPPSRGLPWSGYFRQLAHDPAGCIEAYTGWLETAEAPLSMHLAALCKAQRKQGDAAGVLQTVARFHPWDQDHSARSTAAKVLSWALRKTPGSLRRLRVAVLPTFTPGALVPCLQVAAVRLGLALEVRTTDMDQVQLEILDPQSGLYTFDPEVVILATTHRDLTAKHPAAEQAQSWTTLWGLLAERTNAQIFQHLFDTPTFEPSGHLAQRGPSLTTTVLEVNAELRAHTNPRVSLVDYSGVVARFGTIGAHDARQWFWAKQALVPAVMPALAEEYVAMLRPLVGRTRKVLVLDLDNTLWGGVVGEVGVQGLQIGGVSVEGEAHLALQRYALQLKRQGVLLAVCSKNNPEDARAPFEQVPEMMLKLDDLVAFEACWEPKPLVLRRMADALNLGLNSFVFVDDNPAERARMRQQAPEVLTIPLPNDIAGFVPALHQARAFEVLALSSEDGLRTASYQAERARKTLRAATTPEAYYQSLEMVAQVEPFGPENQARVVQLAARSNQFNLTTWRIQPADIDRIVADPRTEGRGIRLRDRYGDYGMVLVFVVAEREAVLHIDALFMSCRVIARTVEVLALQEIERIARARGIDTLTATYRPTPKNQQLVSALYARLGFVPDGADAEGTHWRRVLDGPPTHNPYISLDPGTP